MPEGPDSPAAAAVPRRTVHCADALGWLAAQGVIEGASFVTSLPDLSELRPMALASWRSWFSDAAARVVRACPDDGVALFQQTDTIIDGEWQDKAFLVTRGAEAAGARLLFHRIACRDNAGAPHHGRPAYSHLLGFSRAVRLRRDTARIDVLPSVGPAIGSRSWSKGMGLTACADAIRFVRDHTASRTVIDPFCGRGTVLAVANALGFDAVGVELIKRRAQVARNLRVESGVELE
jgi:hypothetical protein